MKCFFPKILIFTCLLCVGKIVFAQGKSEIDSLRQVAQTSKDDSLQIFAYFHLYGLLLYNDPETARACIDTALQLAEQNNRPRAIVLCYDKYGGHAMTTSNYPDARRYFQKADSMLQGMDWPREQAIIYGNIAAIYKDQAKYDSSLVWIDRFVALARSIDHTGFEAYGLTLTGDIYHAKGQHELSVRNYLKALRIYETLDEPARTADTYRLLGASQTSALSYEYAEENLRKAGNTYKELNDIWYLAQTYRDLGYLFFLQEQYDSATTYYQQAIDYSKTIDDPFGQAQGLDNLAEVALRKEKYAEAERLAQTAIGTFIQIEDNFSTGNARHTLGNALLGQQKNKEALIALKQALTELKEVGATSSLKFVYKSLAETYSALGNSRQALLNFKEYATIKDSLFTAEKAARMEEQQLIYQVEKKDQEIELLSRDVALEQLRRQRLGIALLALAVLAAFVVYHLYSRRKKERKLAAERHRRQAAELEKTQIARQQLERELASQALQLCRKNEMLARVQQQVGDLEGEVPSASKTNIQKLQRSIESNLQSDTDWQQFIATFEQVHPRFLHELNAQSGGLTPAEARLACLLKMNISSKDIATMLNISTEGVKKARYRLRKKLNIDTSQHLQEYLMRQNAEHTKN